ncbi:MAG: hypothetical protein WBD18_02645 [Phycisphaerae bacterium]
MIRLNYGGQFDEQTLIEYIRSTGRDYIVQGQQACALAEHTKPNSLDYWLRQFAQNPDTKQADNTVIRHLVLTGLFKVADDLLCPDSGRLCKGVRHLTTDGSA